VDTTELGDAVVAVLEEDPVVEGLGPLQSDRRIDRLVAGRVELADELVEEQPSERLGRTRPRAGSPGRTPGRRGS
jgi:hypothetical protein